MRMQVIGLVAIFVLPAALANPTGGEQPTCLKKAASSYSTKIGAFRMSGCQAASGRR